MKYYVISFIILVAVLGVAYTALNSDQQHPAYQSAPASQSGISFN
jgi:hypothetical protein